MPRANRTDDLDPDLQRLGKALRELRHEADMKQIEVAHAAGVSESLVNQLERGRTNPHFLTLLKVTQQGLGLQIADLAIRYDEIARRGPRGASSA